MRLRNGIIPLIFLFLFLLLGCASQNTQSGCCPQRGELYTSNSAYQCAVITLNATPGVSQSLDCSGEIALPDADDNYIRQNCTFHCNDRSACLEQVLWWCPEGCETTEGYLTQIPKCAAVPADPCVNQNCTAMVCGSPSYSQRVSMSLSDYLSSISSADPGTSQQIQSVATEYPSQPEGLYATSCDFKPLTKKTQREFKTSPSLFINTFRFGTGDSFEEFKEDRLYYPITDKFSGTTDYGAYQKDRYTNYVDITSQSGTGIDPDEWGKLTGVGGSANANCFSNIENVIDEITDPLSLDSPFAGLLCTSGSTEPGSGGALCWGASWNATIVKRIRWTCGATLQDYASKGACMLNCYPEDECSLPIDDVHLFPFLNEDGNYTMASPQTLILTPTSGDPIEQEITSSLDTSYYSNELNSQYSFEISNGFCPEIGCVCGDETGEVTDPDCSEYDTQILNRLPGASFMCESNAECYSRVCSNTVISTQKCVRHGGPEDGQPVDCGCETNEYGEIVCDVGETVTKMRALQPSSFGGGECGDDQTTCFACCIPWTQNLVGAYPSNFEWFNPSANNGNCYIAEQYQHRDESCDAYLIGVGCIAWSCSWGTMVPAFLSEGIPSQIAPDPTPYTGPQIRANQLTSSAGELWTDDVAYTVVDTQFVGTFNTPEFWNNVRDAVKLIDECNLIYDQSDSNRDVYAFQIPTIYPKFHQTADSHCDDHQCDIHGEDNYYPLTLSGLYKLVFKTHEDPENPGTYALGSCKTDPDDPSKLLMYHYGTCEPGSLLTSAVQEIPPQTPFPVCLTTAPYSYGACILTGEYPNNYCTSCASSSPFGSYRDQTITGINVIPGTMASQGPYFSPSPQYLDKEIRQLQKAYVTPIMTIPEKLSYKSTVSSNTVPANLAKYLKNQGTIILAINDSTYYPEILLPADSPSSPLHPNILRQQTLAQQVQNQVSYYKERFSKALIALKIISVAPYEIILDSETFTVSDAISKAHALLLNEKAEGTTTYSANGMTYKPIIHGPSTGTKNQQTLNSIDIILLSPAVPDFGYFHYGQGMAFCVLSPEEQAKVYVEYLSNISRQILQDYNLPTLVYLEEAGTYGTGPICPWNDIKRANLTKEIMRYSANLSYAGIIGLHDPHPYQAPSLSNPAEDQPFCMLQEASRLSVELQTHSAYYKLSAQDSACTCEPCTRMEQSAGKCSPACADGASCDMEGVQAGWPYGYKCPSLCANTDSCEERLCEGILVDFPSSSGNLICQYSDVPMSFEVSPEALLASPDNYADILSSLPEVYRCCFSEIDEYGETDYYSYSKLDTQGREVFPIIYGTKGRDFPECKPSADISESCVFSQFYSNNQLTCGFSEGEFGVSPFPDLCIPGKYGSGIVCPSLPGFYSGPSCCQSGMEQWCCGSDETYGNTCESSYSCSTSLSPSHYCGEENICSSPNPYCCRAELEPGEGYTTFCCPDQNTCLTAPSSCALA